MEVFAHQRSALGSLLFIMVMEVLTEDVSDKYERWKNAVERKERECK